MRVVALAPVVLVALACEPNGDVPDPPPPPVVLESPYTIDPPSCDFGVVAVNAVGACTLTITNVNDEDVNVAAITGAPFIALNFAGALAPGASRDIIVNAAPRVVGNVEGELALGPGRLIVPLVVEGTAPDIVIDVDVTPLDPVVGLDSFTFDASASAPADSFEWTIIALPDGSSAQFDDDAAPIGTLTPDVAGNYRVNVHVTDGVGGSADLQILTGARTKRELAVTTTGGVLHLRPFAPDEESACGALDCYAGHCTDLAWSDSARSTPTAAGGGILVEDLAEGTYRATIMGADTATVSAFDTGALIAENAATIGAGDAVDVFDVVATRDGIAIEDVSETVVGGACDL